MKIGQIEMFSIIEECMSYKTFAYRIGFWLIAIGLYIGKVG
ncbi:MAG: hypothetical protein ACRCX8_05155 [Sarcina sp.]